MGIGKTWPPEEDELLKKFWLRKGDLRKRLDLFPGRSYEALVSHAHRLKLGRRPFSSRGIQPYAWKLIRAELKKAPGTASEIAKRTSLTITPVCERLEEAKPGPKGKCHICGWKRRGTGGKAMPVYAIGPGENMPKPKPLSAAEKSRIFRARNGGSRAVPKSCQFNPFATALGLIVPPPCLPGRIYQQPMDIRDDEMEAA